MQLIIHDILDEETNAMIVGPGREVTNSFHKGKNKDKIESKILNEAIFPFDQKMDTQVVKEMMLPSNTEENVMGAIPRFVLST